MILFFFLIVGKKSVRLALEAAVLQQSEAPLNLIPFPLFVH